MSKKIRKYMKLNLLSLFFIAVSFISITLAWFAYSGISRVEMDIPVKAWYIKIEKDGKPVSNEVVVSLSEIYPGMDTVSEVLKIQNLGDSGAELKYSIISARILDEEILSSDVEDLLANELPFSINMSLNKRHIDAGGDEGYFEVSVSWPLDSGHDELDSEWGNKAYAFEVAEKAQHNVNPEYRIKQSIQIVISVTAEQFLGNDDSSDPKYQLGDEIFFDVENNKRCTEIGLPNCIKTYVIDLNNTIGEDTVTLLPNPLNTYLSDVYGEYDNLFATITTNWNVNVRKLYIEDLLQVISNDVTNSLLIRNDLSDSIIGIINNDIRMTKEIDKIKSSKGYYQYRNDKFDYLSSSICYWINSEYDNEKAFALKRIDTTYSQIYGHNKNDPTCKVIPVILADKNNLE